MKTIRKMTKNNDTNNTKRDGNTNSSRSRTWVFTLNNYSEKETNDLISLLYDTNYVIGKEIGAEMTPHLQGFIEFKNARTFSSVKKLLGDRFHIEKCKNKNASIKYCQKEGNYLIKGIEEERNIKQEILNEIYSDVVWKPWQNKVLEIIQTKPDARTIHYIVDEKGNNGKTFLTKFICCTNEKAIVVAGKGDNVLYGLSVMEYPEVIIFDIPRSAQNFISYGAIEKAKDGIFFSGKYESKMTIYKSPHVFVLVNQDLAYESMSLDRWNEIKIPNSRENTIVEWEEEEC